MEFGVFLPISGRAAGPETLREAAASAERLGYHSVWAADRIVIPWEIKTTYPYSADRRFIVPADRPFLEPLTCLAFLVSCTERIRLGLSVLVLPYRHPLYSAKVASTIDRLSKGRLILGIGVGWMEEEFRALGVPFGKRGEISDEQLQILKRIWSTERSGFEGRHYKFDDIAFFPKPAQNSRIPIWVGGEGKRAQSRAGEHGDAWFPYFVKITPQELARKFENVRRRALEAGRDADEIQLACCLPIELSSRPLPQEAGSLKGSPLQLAEALEAYKQIGLKHLALQFMVPHWPDRKEQMETFAREVIPLFRDSSEEPPQGK